MKTPGRSRTSRVPHCTVLFAQQSLCYDGRRHSRKGADRRTHKQTNRQTDTQTGPILLPRLLMREVTIDYNNKLQYISEIVSQRKE